MGGQQMEQVLVLTTMHDSPRGDEIGRRTWRAVSFVAAAGGRRVSGKRLRLCAVERPDWEAEDDR